MRFVYAREGVLGLGFCCSLRTINLHARQRLYVTDVTLTYEDARNDRFEALCLGIGIHTSSHNRHDQLMIEIERKNCAVFT
jgi:hypothetical protein